jgi:hypothetical protein
MTLLTLCSGVETKEASALWVAGPPNTKLVVLYSSMNDPDWPDFLDLTPGTFTYFGDNKRPGCAL